MDTISFDEVDEVSKIRPTGLASHGRSRTLTMRMSNLSEREYHTEKLGFSVQHIWKLRIQHSMN